MRPVDELHHESRKIWEATRQLIRARPKVRNVNEELAAERSSVNERIADRTTALVGTMYAFYLFAVLMGGWILWQGYLASKPFDGYPFPFLLFLGNIVQLLLMPLIMVGQNVQGRAQARQATADFETNVKAEKEIETVLMHLEHQNELMLEILRRLETSPRAAA